MLYSDSETLNLGGKSPNIFFCVSFIPRKSKELFLRTPAQMAGTGDGARALGPLQ